MRCDNCPAAWAERDIMTACGVEHGEWGCLIKGLEYGGEGESCHRTKAEIEKILDELKQYASGEIRRPKWVLQRFLNDLASQMDTVECGLPGFPKMWQAKDDNREDDYCICVRPLYGSTDLHYERKSAYRRGYEDAKEGKECNAEYWKFAFQQRKGSRCGEMIEKQVIVTWFTPEEKLPPDEKKMVIVTFSGRDGSILYDHALRMGIWCDNDDGWCVSGWIIEGLSYSAEYVIHAWCDLKSYRG